MLFFGSRTRRTVQRTLSAIVAGLMLTCARAETPATTGMLPEDYLPGLKLLLEDAVKQSPQMLLQQIEIVRREAQIYERDYQRYPNVGGNFRYDATQQSVTGSAATRSSGLFYSMQVNQAVFHWGEIKHQSQIARLDVAIAQKNYAEAFRVLALQIRQTYLDLIARNAQLRQARFTLKLKEADLASARERLAHGTTSPLDVASRQVTRDEAELDVERQRAQFDSLRRALSRMAGLPKDIPAEQIPAEIPQPRYDSARTAQLLADFLRDGAKDTFKAQVADLNAKEADLNYRIARVRLLPKINASFSHDRNSWTTIGGTNVSQTALTNDTLEVRGDWNVFDGFATKGYKLEALAQKRAAEHQKQIEIDAAMDEAQRLARMVDIDARAMQLAQEHLGGAMSGVATAQEDMKAGRASQTDLDAATSLQRLAEWNVAMARDAFLSDWAAFVSRTSGDPALNQLPYRYVRATR
ncbi:MAG TPA: TolC family protein [Opitutaceae bacterium]|nr:TolC family protein [Opitutaceae bacterium]